MRRAAKFTGPDDERVLQHAVRTQIGEQRGDGLIDGHAGIWQVFRQLEMMIPVAVHHFDKTHACLDHATCEQALAAKVVRRAVSADAIRIECRLQFLRETHHIRHLALHLEGEFKRLDRALDLAGSHSPCRGRRVSTRPARAARTANCPCAASKTTERARAARCASS